MTAVRRRIEVITLSLATLRSNTRVDFSGVKVVATSSVR